MRPITAEKSTLISKILDKNVIKKDYLKRDMKCCCIYIDVYFSPGKTHNLDPRDCFTGTTRNAGEVAVALYNGLFAFAGW